MTTEDLANRVRDVRLTDAPTRDHLRVLELGVRLGDLTPAQHLAYLYARQNERIIELLERLVDGTVCNE